MQSVAAKARKSVRRKSGMFCFAVRQLPIKACNLMLHDGRVMSITYRIEVQLNKKVSKITLRKASLFFWVQRDPISFLNATVIKKLANSNSTLVNITAAEKSM